MEPTQTSFNRWVETLLDPSGYLADWAPAVFWDIYLTEGAVTPERVSDIVQKRIRVAAENALHAVTRDLSATTSSHFPFRLEQTEAGTRVTFQGGHGPDPVFSPVLAEATVEVASAIQEEVCEELWTPWPSCSIHSYGLHPQLQDDAAVWFCLGGDHQVAVIGELNQDNPPGQES